MLVAILSIALILCSIGCLVFWLGMMSLTMYMIAKEYTLPTEEESKACMKEVLRRSFRFGR